MKIKSTEKQRIFIPEFNGNKDLPDAEQVRVHIKKFPPTSTLKSYRKISYSADGMVSIDYPADASLIQAHVGVIENLEMEGKDKVYDGRSLALSTNRELANLVAEIRTYLIGNVEETLTEGEN